MSIKKLFGQTDENTNYLSDTNEKNLFKAVESAKNASEIYKKQQEFNPQIDYSQAANFARYGSARLYYSGAIGRILDYYPYDGSEAEQNQFYNKSLGVERYIFDSLWPRTNGYANFNSASYIDFRGGPNTISSSTTAGLFKDEDSSKRAYANVYDEQIYRSDGLPSNYGTGSRQSNLRTNFDSGVTLEFWLKSKDLTADANSVVFDMWNNNASGSVDMGRMTIEILSASSASPFLFTVQSGTMTSGMPGSGTLFQQSIGQNLTSTTLDDWKHYAFVFHNSGSDFVTKLYVNGYENHTVINSNKSIGELPSKDMLARIGSFLTSPFRSDAAASTRAANTHLLTGSVDEFRFWKEARSSADIGQNWFKQVRGGTNSDISNTTLGVYYKFNEGTTGASSIDKNVLDYSGRLSNGVWTGTASRTISSAILESSASTVEYKDPIIYVAHPRVTELKNGLDNSGSFHDFNNNTNFYSYMPSWIMEDHDRIGNDNPQIISHILGTYFDKAYALITSLPTLKAEQNTSASFSPISFAQHLPESLGLNTPNLFVESDVLNSFLNMTKDFEFGSDLSKTKNLIYQNLYNNLSDIYKSKGTERAIKNVLRCFYLDDSIIKFKTYADNNVYELETQSLQILKNKNMMLLNTSSNVNAVCYLRQDPDDTTNSRGYISGSAGTTTLGGGGGYEDGYGFTAEANVRFPRFSAATDQINRESLLQSSIFGIYSASVDKPDDPMWVFDNGGADFQVYANRLKDSPTSVYFSVTSSLLPTYEITSSTFFDVYNNTDWNISVRLKPSTYPLATFVTGNTTNFTYDLIFEGISANLGTVMDNFVLTASVSKAVGTRFLNSAKRVYAGANRTNMTGTVNYKSDVLISDVKYWAKYLDSDSLKQHALDFENRGISGSFRNIAPYAPKNVPHELLNRETLALHWNFSDLTSSDGSGNFLTQDISSGSAADAASNGWLGGISGFLHKGFGYGFTSNSTSIKSSQQVNTFKFIDPEQAVSSDMINILSNDDEVYGFSSTIPNFYNTLEKSMYDAISEEMLTFFAGAIDFHNLIGEPVNRYRERYKAMEHLRRLFFKRVNSVKEVEKYIEYYKWFDSAISSIVGQMVPAASKFTDNLMNVIESHVLERNKYRTLFPTLEFQSTDPETPMLGIRERLYQWSKNHHPISEQATDNPDWWRDRAERNGNPTIGAGNTDLDAQRDIYRETIANDNNQKKEVRGTLTQGSYEWTSYVKRKLSLPYKFDAIVESDYLTTYAPLKSIKGGVNFRTARKMGYVYNALRPAGRIFQDDGNFVPENVLFAQFLDTDGTLKDLIRETRYKRGLVYGPEPHPNDQLYRNRPSEKVMLNVRVRHGRDGTGYGYESMKSIAAFPFNIVSSSVTTGYNREVVERVTGNIQITNLHHDVYGDDMEKPMQTIFTEHTVGGHQSRHVPINIGSDNEKNRPEAWKIYLGYPTGDECGNVGNASGAIGMVGPDYPQPNAGYETGMPPYPATSSQKAPWYRGFVAKRPVNITNIKHTTGAAGKSPTILGNYNHTYEIIQTVGAASNPIGFRDEQPAFPEAVFKDGSNSNKATSIRTLRDINRTSSGHSGVGEYSTSYLTGAKNKSVIIQRFSHRGGIEVMSRGYQDFRSTEFSVYNAVPYRNLTVRTPNQAPSTTISNKVVNGDTTDIQVSDIHGLDYGLIPHLTRHSARFGRDSLFFPYDEDRKRYNLNESFIGYGDKKIYRNGDKLMGWWRLDNNIFTTAVSSSALDSSGNSRDGTFPHGDGARPTFSSTLGPSDFIQTGSANFDGGGSSVDTGIDIGTAATWDAIIGNDTANGSNEKFTIAAWIYKVGDGENNFGRIIDFGNSDIALYTNLLDEIRFIVKRTIGATTAEVQWSSTGTDIGLNKWVHLAISYDATDADADPQFYINGSPTAATLTTGTKGGTYYGIVSQDCIIGNRDNGGAFDRTWDGNLADVAIWNTVLTDEDIAAVYNASIYEEERGPGYDDELPSFHKVHRNSRVQARIQEETPQVYDVYEGPQEQNENSLYFLEPETYGSMLINAETASAPTFLSASRTAGFTYSGWVRLDPSTSRANNGNAYFFGVGKCASSSEPFVEISKTSASIAIELATRTSITGYGGSSRRSEYNISTNASNCSEQAKLMNSGSWVHLAVSVPVSSALPGPSFPSVYINGVSQTVTESNTPYNYWDAKPDTGTTSILGGVQRDGTGSFAIGRNPAKASSGLAQFGTSGAIDQLTVWTVALSSSEVSELYNGGIPCDVTSSTTYANSSSHLFAWYKVGEKSPTVNDNDAVNTSNTMVFNSSSNVIWNSARAEHHLFPICVSTEATNNGLKIAGSSSGGTYPIPLTGCVQTFVGQSASVDIIYSGDTKNDNYFVQHPIPRSDRQYSFFTAAIEDPNPRNVRYSGYMPVFGPAQGMYKSGSNYETWMTMLSTSEFGYSMTDGDENNNLGALKGWQSTTYAPTWKGQDFAGLNTMIYEPIQASSSMLNVLGWPTACDAAQRVMSDRSPYPSQSVGTPLFNWTDTADPGDQYRNARFNNKPDGGGGYGGFWDQVQGAVSASYPNTTFAIEGQIHGYLFNTLMLKRNGPYGYGTHAMAQRNRNHPILRSERSSSTISVYNPSKRQLEKYSLQPVSKRARPTLINYTPYDPSTELGNSANPGSANKSITLKISDMNEKIMFQDVGLNEMSKVDPNDIVTGLDHMLMLLNKHPDYGLNWMVYSENVFPSVRNEFVSHSRTRIGYDQQFWRDVRNLRNDLGNKSEPSIGRATAPTYFVSAQMVYCSQSSWPLDAQANFLTRTGSIVGANTVVGTFTASQRPSPFKGAGVNRNYLRAGPFGGTTDMSNPVQIAVSNSAGELQNNYGHAHFAHDAAHGGRGSKYDGQFTFISCGGLYARKHMLGPFLSVANPTGMEIEHTGTFGLSPVQRNWAHVLTQSVFINAGEAEWEAGTQAGIIRRAARDKFKFISKPSKPWYDSYEEFRQDIMMLAKDYVIVPEFRISEHVEDYTKLDIFDNGKFDTFEIPGTGITSVTGTFYDEYMNSSKLEHFRQQGLKTNLTAKEIKISVKAVKKFNPYKGFYPVQRTIDLVKQFSSSYNNSIQVKRVARIKAMDLIGHRLAFFPLALLAQFINPFSCPVFYTILLSLEWQSTGRQSLVQLRKVAPRTMPNLPAVWVKKAPLHRDLFTQTQQICTHG